MGDRNLSSQNQTSHIFNGSIHVGNITDFEENINFDIKEYFIFVPIISSMGIVGNFVSFVVFVQLSKLSSFYLYLAFLALSDFAMLVFGGIFPWLQITGFVQIYRSKYQLFCTVDFSFTHMFMELSSWITAAVTIDRFIAICYPFHVKQYCTRKRALIHIGVAFLVIAALNLPMTCLEWDDENSSCVMPEFANVYCLQYGTYIELAFYILIPVGLICIFNSLIVRGLIIAANRRRHLASGNTNSSCSTPLNDSTSKTATMLFAVTTFFIASVIPLVALIVTQKNIHNVENMKSDHLAPVADICTLLNHSMNFVLYGVLGKRFREKFALMFCFRRFFSN